MAPPSPHDPAARRWFAACIACCVVLQCFLLRQASTTTAKEPSPPVIIVAYAISITQCPTDDRKFGSVLDGAAVLAHSIHLNSVHHSKSRYGYKLYAFVHPDARNCTTHLPLFNYTRKIVKNPINASLIQNEVYRKRVQDRSIGCCQGKEFIKLYALTLEKYPIVVHLDSDTMLLQPMDDLFNVLLQPDNEPKHLGSHAMWEEDRVVSRRIESLFTHDYPQGLPDWPAAHYGVQAGFWIVRPNQTAFHEMRHLVLQGNFSSGWYDGTVHYPNFYGAGMIAGLLGFFYGHLHPGQAVELNHCYHNNMADDPFYFWKQEERLRCLVPHTPPEQCQDCRKTNFSDIYSFHTTCCAKPTHCRFYGGDDDPKNSMCNRFTNKWFETRHHLETAAWGLDRPLTGLDRPLTRHFFGYCGNDADKPLVYVPINHRAGKQIREPIGPAEVGKDG